MKTLNLKLFAVTVFLAACFASLPPYQAQAVIMMPPNMDIKVDKSLLNANPKAVGEAIQTARKYAQKANPSGDVSIEISTNAPAGYTFSTNNIGQPIILPHVALCAGPLLVIVEIVVVIIILGVAIYITCKVVKWINCVTSNANWQATNGVGGDVTIAPAGKGPYTLAGIVSTPLKASKNPTYTVNLSGPWAGKSQLDRVNYNTIVLASDNPSGLWTPKYDINFNITDNASLTTAGTLNSIAINGNTVDLANIQVITDTPSNKLYLVLYTNSVPMGNSGFFRTYSPLPIVP